MPQMADTAMGMPARTPFWAPIMQKADKPMASNVSRAASTASYVVVEEEEVVEGDDQERDRVVSMVSEVQFDDEVDDAQVSLSQDDFDDRRPSVVCLC